jgi:hypothetical protein
MTTTGKQQTPRWLAGCGVVAASGAVLMGFWQVANLALGWAVGSYVSQLEWIIRVSAASGVVATLATLPIAKLMMRFARRSVMLSMALFPLGVVGMYYLVPRVFVYAMF